MNKIITTVDWILSRCIFPTFNKKEQMHYSCPRIINDLFDKGEIRINGNKIKSLFQEVYIGDVVYYNGKEHCFNRNDLLCAWLGNKL